MPGEEIAIRMNDLALSPVIDLTTAIRELAVFQNFVKGYMVEGEDYGKIPGTPKPTLYKPGADKLCEIYGLADEYDITQRVEKWEMVPPLFDYEVKCTLVRKRDGIAVSTGMGSCNSYEGKYRWRDSKPICPMCNQETVLRSKEPGKGWFCWKKKGGCGASFPENEPTLIDQKIGKVPNDDVATLKNTILKMAKKRAKVDACLSATRSAGIFTQDMEDITRPTPKPPDDTEILRHELLDLMDHESFSEAQRTKTTTLVESTNSVLDLRKLKEKAEKHILAWETSNKAQEALPVTPPPVSPVQKKTTQPSPQSAPNPANSKMESELEATNLQNSIIVLLQDRVEPSLFTTVLKKVSMFEGKWFASARQIDKCKDLSWLRATWEACQKIPEPQFEQEEILPESTDSEGIFPPIINGKLVSH
jgi:hypothetical protein